MSMTTLFSVANLTVMPFWLLMVFAPRWRGTARLVRSPLIVLAPIAAYAALVLPRLAGLLPVVARPELDPVRALLGSPLGATAAWAHFLAFDLFVGRWIFLDARDHALPARFVSPVLVLTLLLGPLGLLAYLGVRAMHGGRSGAAIRDLVRRARTAGPSLMRLAAGSVALLGAALLAQLFDHRLVLGASVWAKPAKFGASVALTAVTLALLLPHLDMPARGRRWAVALISWFTGLELVLISLQSLRGVPSHFNAAAPFDVAVFAAMGIGIAIVTAAIAYLAYRAFRTRFAADRALGWGIRLGLVTMLFGASIGGLMPAPTAAQKAQIAAGEAPAIIGAHTVGGPDGGPGLPVTRWSTDHGDLRVPHFLGLHGLQLLPLAGWLLGRRRRDGAALTFIAGAGYLGLAVTALVEALRGRPLLSPDAVTLALAGAILLAAAAAGAATVVVGRARGGVGRYVPGAPRALGVLEKT